MRRGIVSSRVALLLRSIEIKPLLFRFEERGEKTKTRSGFELVVAAVYQLGISSDSWLC